MAKKAKEFRKRMFEIVEIGYGEDSVSRGYDFFCAFVVILNLTVNVMQTFQDLNARFGTAFKTIEFLTIAFFAVDYVLRLWTADHLYRNEGRPQAMLRYIFSFSGIIDLLSFLPYFLPVMFPDGAVAFRMIRVIRIFRLFRINSYYDSLNVITEVLRAKRQALVSSVFIILVLMLASSLCMYSLEHEAQPEVFQNAFSGIWWSASTLLTVGYGDIYPVTTLGKILGIIISFLGVGMVAIPTGIISAGFVEQYALVKKFTEESAEESIRFIKVRIGKKDVWEGKQIGELGIPAGMIIAAVHRDEDILIPHGNMVLKDRDVLIIGALDTSGSEKIDLREMELKHKNRWNGMLIRDLDLSRQTFIVLVRRKGKAIIPKGDLRLEEGDRLLLYTKVHLPDTQRVVL